MEYTRRFADAKAKDGKCSSKRSAAEIRARKLEYFTSLELSSFVLGSLSLMAKAVMSSTSVLPSTSGVRSILGNNFSNSFWVSLNLERVSD